jgi:hypothetical protein
VQPPPALRTDAGSSEPPPCSAKCSEGAASYGRTCTYQLGMIHSHGSAYTFLHELLGPNVLGQHLIQHLRSHTPPPSMSDEHCIYSTGRAGGDSMISVALDKSGKARFGWGQVPFNTTIKSVNLRVERLVSGRFLAGGGPASPLGMRRGGARAWWLRDELLACHAERRANATDLTRAHQLRTVHRPRMEEKRINKRENEVGGHSEDRVGTRTDRSSLITPALPRAPAIWCS